MNLVEDYTLGTVLLGILADFDPQKLDRRFSVVTGFKPGRGRRAVRLAPGTSWPKDEECSILFVPQGTSFSADYVTFKKTWFLLEWEHRYPKHHCENGMDLAGTLPLEYQRKLTEKLMERAKA